MNDGHFPASGQPAGGALPAPLLARPYVVVGELPEAMAEPGGRGAHYWPVLQLIKDWNNQPDARERMLAGGLQLTPTPLRRPRSLRWSTPCAHATATRCRPG